MWSVSSVPSYGFGGSPYSTSAWCFFESGTLRTSPGGMSTSTGQPSRVSSSRRRASSADPGSPRACNRSSWFAGRAGSSCQHRPCPRPAWSSAPLWLRIRCRRSCSYRSNREGLSLPVSATPRRHSGVNRFLSVSARSCRCRPSTAPSLGGGVAPVGAETNAIPVNAQTASAATMRSRRSPPFQDVSATPLSSIDLRKHPDRWAAGHLAKPPPRPLVARERRIRAGECRSRSLTRRLLISPP